MTTPDSSGFSGLGIAPGLLTALLQLGFKTPTPIQQRSIPIGIEGKDMIGVAQTGTGKTMAFGIPMIQRLAQVKGQGLVVLPTRELALQVDDALHSIGKSIGLRTAVLIGGASMYNQQQAIRKNPHIIICTPGRIIDHLEQRFIKLDNVKVLVLDEADRMLDMGFAPQVNRILASVPKERQTMLFSATMPNEIVTIAQKYMQLPVRVEIARPGTAASKVVQELFFIGKEAKTMLLEQLLRQTPGSVLVFTRTKFAAKKLSRRLMDQGFTSADIHSDRTLAQRRSALDGFKSGRYRVLVATDIAARGIDVTNIELVVNYDLPTNPEDYVHRIGRTGRAGLAGKAVSFATFDQRHDVRDIERLMRTTLKVSPLPAMANVPPSAPYPARPNATPHRHGGQLPVDIDIRQRPRPPFRPGQQRPSFRGRSQRHNPRGGSRSQGHTQF